MKHVPRGTLLIVATTTRVMIAKTVDDGVPNWQKPFDQQGLTQRYPNIVNYEVTTKEVIDIEIASLLD